MDETSFTLSITSILIVVILLGIYFGRKNRTKRQHYVASPIAVPDHLLASEPQIIIEGTYVSTVLGQDLLERVTAHRLGNPSSTQIEVHDQGVVLLRAGEPNIFIPDTDIHEVENVSGIAGKFVEKNGVLAVTWNLGNNTVTTGLRTETVTDHQSLYNALKKLTNGRQTA